MNNNFFNTTPKNFMFDYVVSDEIKNSYSDLIKMDDYSEELADKYMYEENKFKDEQSRDIIYKYDKEALQVEGMKILFTKLQNDPTNRNIMIRKSKSGKCYMYDSQWVEKKLQKIIVKICNKLCDALYDKETSLNHFSNFAVGEVTNSYARSA